MFHAETSPTIYKDGFFGFFDHAVLPSIRSYEGSERLAIHHVIAPALSPDDNADYEHMAADKTNESRIVSAKYMEYIAQAKNLGCVTMRLQIAPGGREEITPDSAFVRWQCDVYAKNSVNTGEIARLTWLDEQQGRLAACLDDQTGRETLQDFNQGFEHRIPTGGYWALHEETARRRVLKLAEVVYHDNGQEVVFDGLYAYDPASLSPATLRYISFWNGVMASDQSVGLQDFTAKCV